MPAAGYAYAKTLSPLTNSFQSVKNQENKEISTPVLSQRLQWLPLYLWLCENWNYPWQQLHRWEVKIKGLGNHQNNLFHMPWKVRSPDFSQTRKKRLLKIFLILSFNSSICPWNFKNASWNAWAYFINPDFCQAYCFRSYSSHFYGRWILVIWQRYCITRRIIWPNHCRD